jgi:cysteine desulfurase
MSERKNPSVTLSAQIDGGGHERNMRSGTLNVPGIVGFGKACEICASEMASENKRLAKLRNAFEVELLVLDDISINGEDIPRLPHATNISFGHVDGEKMIFEAGSDIAFSRSSACTSATLEPSYVLKAMGISDEAIHHSFRFSFGRFTTEEQTNHAIKILSKNCKRTRHEGDHGHHQIV